MNNATKNEAETQEAKNRRTDAIRALSVAEARWGNNDPRTRAARREYAETIEEVRKLTIPTN